MWCGLERINKRCEVVTIFTTTYTEWGYQATQEMCQLFPMAALGAEQCHQLPGKHTQLKGIATQNIIKKKVGINNILSHWYIHL